MSLGKKKQNSSCRTTVQCKLFEKLTILQGNSGEFTYNVMHTLMVRALKQNELNRIVTNPLGALSVITKSQKIAKGYENKFWNHYYKIWPKLRNPTSNLSNCSCSQNSVRIYLCILRLLLKNQKRTHTIR